MITIQDILIRPITASDSIDEITEVLHAAYKQLAELGFKYLATHQDSKTTLKRINDGNCFVTELNNRIIETICYYPKENANGCNWYDKEGVASFGQFGVLPNIQGQGIGNKFMDFVEDQAKIDGADELALDTAEGATHLIKWYERRGYRFIEYANWKLTNYRSVIMSKQIK